MRLEISAYQRRAGDADIAPRSNDVPYYDRLADVLLKAELLNACDILDGNVEIVDISRRNSNYQVLLEGIPQFIVKCSNGQTGLGTVAHEAAAYDWLEMKGRSDRLPHIPKRLHWHDAEGMLVLEAVVPSISASILVRTRKGLSLRRAGLIGKSLASLHNCEVPSESLPVLPRDWFLSVHLPNLTAIENMSFAALGMTRQLQQFSRVCADLEALSDKWTATAPINGDVKWDNIIFRRLQYGFGSQHPVVIDWEFLGLGDPAWDIGSIFAEYLFAWTQASAKTLSGADDVDIAVSFALEKHLGEVAAFWKGYLSVSKDKSDDLIVRVMQFCAGRLILKCFEALQESSSGAARMQPTLQLAANILERPIEAVAHLLSLPVNRRPIDA